MPLAASRRRSSSNADILAPLVEDEALGLMDQGVIDDAANRTEWSEASRSSCPTLVVARGCSSCVGLDPAAALGQAAISCSSPWFLCAVMRPHSAVGGAPVKPGGPSVSPVSAATSRSIASPMRLDFMTLMRQASNRGSSGGLTGDPGTPTRGLPPPWSSGLMAPSDTCRSGSAAAAAAAAECRLSPADCAVTAASQQETYGGNTSALDAAQQRRKRRASALAAAGNGGALGGGSTVAAAATTPGGGAASCCPPGHGPGSSVGTSAAAVAAVAFARCSSSPDIRPGGGVLSGTVCSSTASGERAAAAPPHLMTYAPYTAPRSVEQPGSSTASSRSYYVGGCRGGCGSSSRRCSVSGGGSSSGGCGGGGGVPPGAVFRTCQVSAGRNSVEVRAVQPPSLSPLRPRGLPMRTAAAAAAAAACAVSGHSTSALPKYTYAPSLKATGAISWIDSCVPRGLAAVVPPLPAAAAKPEVVRREVVDMEGAVAMAATAAVRPPFGSGVTADADAAAAAVRGLMEQLSGPLALSGECSGVLLPDRPSDSSAAQPYITRFLKAAPAAGWISRGYCCTGGGGGDGGGPTAGSAAAESWGAGSSSRGGGGGTLPLPTLPPAATAAITVLPTSAFADDDASGGAGADGDPSANVALLQGVVVGSLGDTLTAVDGCPDGAASSVVRTGAQTQPGVGASSVAEAEQAILVIQNLLERDVLPDGTEPLAPVATADATSAPLLTPAVGRHAASPSPQLFKAFNSNRGQASWNAMTLPGGGGGDGGHLAVHGSLRAGVGAPTAAAAATTSQAAQYGPVRLPVDIGECRAPSVCSPTPSHLLTSPTFLASSASPSTFPYHGGLESFVSVQNISGNASGGGSSAAAAAAAAAAGGSMSNRSGRTLKIEPCSRCMPSPPHLRDIPRIGTCEMEAAALGGGGDRGGGGGGGGGESAPWVAALNNGGAAMRGRHSLGTRRGSSVIASESSLAAIALLRSAAPNCPLPDDSAGSGGGSQLSVLHTVGAGGAAAVQQVDGGSPHTLRLEDGLVSDPLLLVDGLCHLSYVTSGAYAAVYRGTLDGINVGIKFLASTSLDLKAPAVREALLGPGLEHENIIRTYTTRVARVDRRAVSQLKAIAAAAAMAAAAVLQRKKHSSAGTRRYSNGTSAAACSPLSLPSTPQLRAGAAASQWKATMTTTTTTAPAGGVAAGALSAGASPGRAVSSTSPRTPIGAAVADANVTANITCGIGTAGFAGYGGGGGGGGDAAISAVGSCRRHLAVREEATKAMAKVPAGPMLGLALCNDVVVSRGGVAAATAVAAGRVQNSPQGEVKGRLSSASGVPSEDRDRVGPAAAAAAAAAAVAAAGGSSGGLPRQLYIRKSLSANARTEIAAYDDDAAVMAAAAAAAAAVEEPPSAPSAPLAGLVATADACRTHGQRAVPWHGSVRILGVGARVTLLPQLLQSVDPGMPSRVLVAGPGPAPSCHGSAAAPPRGPGPGPPRGGIAAKRLLDVLRTVGVVGPTGHPTAEAHYVTVVVMEYADAGNLDSFSSSETPCDLATAVYLLRQVACGMSYLHAHGLVHGDLKPANVLLLRDPSTGRLTAKVADFGLSGLSGHQGTNGGADTCGTVAYSAPERLADEEDSSGAEQAADVYSFGICMQQLVSGVRPFADLTFGQVMFSVLCLKMRPSWPEGRCGALEPLYNMCCDPQPEKRPTFEQVMVMTVLTEGCCKLTCQGLTCFVMYYIAA
ncbi:hypothetical protein VOLCADRAFT_91055 [Volvox carteri f. nagariensis]|uniref:Protein kinase domain-containing protein n=1 Tax=Volvox carteri f. nagariensis TaxID=3068 RepID=D8TW24_VOLCA|nr:uncharacterized protein VOLCADRAFT_91055 [Volvox carteri f. nagariensis]EFJ48292.1 hypothetical protein VOLCADRAFT_91055 [Volvox carteri f. nagariensis]|eukprot:XP_002950546.1 hypothetical protein VOLCADRAFT_91055 [Volvox carteri f. nagariensis]